MRVEILLWIHCVGGQNNSATGGINSHRLENSHNLDFKISFTLYLLFKHINKYTSWWYYIWNIHKLATRLKIR